MWVHCPTCRRGYDDAQCWTICPHGPLWAGPHDYCRKCDTVKSLHGPCQHQKESPVENQASQAHHPAIAHVLKFFSYAHLPANLQEVSKPFCDLAQQVAARAPQSQETTVALRKLLEAKDAAVRSIL